MSQGSYDEWYAKGPYQEFVTSRSFDRSKGVSAVIARQPAGDYPDPATSEIVLLQNVGPTSVPANLDNGIAKYRNNWLPGSFDFKLPGEPFHVTVDKDQKGLFTAIDPQRLADTSNLTKQAYLRQIEPILAKGTRDVFLASLMLQLFEEMGKADDRGALFVDSALSMIAARLLRLSDAIVSIAPAVALSKTEEDSLLDAIEELLDTDLSVETLAAVVDRPVSTFHRLFLDTFGRTPHAFLLERRVARARDMLASTDQSIADIAYTCGFSSQQHMTNAFTLKIGTSPGRYRRVLRA